MLNQQRALQAYRSAGRLRSAREQEADVFRLVNATLLSARQAPPVQQASAMADNRRLWWTVSDLMRDPTNQLPEPLRAGILAVGMTVQREMDKDKPNFDFLVSINEEIAEGLAGNAAG